MNSNPLSFHCYCQGSNPSCPWPFLPCLGTDYQRQQDFSSSFYPPLHQAPPMPTPFEQLMVNTVIKVAETVEEIKENIRNSTNENKKRSSVLSKEVRSVNKKLDEIYQHVFGNNSISKETSFGNLERLEEGRQVDMPEPRTFESLEQHGEMIGRVEGIPIPQNNTYRFEYTSPVEPTESQTDVVAAVSENNQVIPTIPLIATLQNQSDPVNTQTATRKLVSTFEQPEFLTSQSIQDSRPIAQTASAAPMLKTKPLEKDINSSNKSTEPTKQMLEETDQRSIGSQVSVNPKSVRKVVKSTERPSTQPKKAENKTTGDHNQKQDTLKPSKPEPESEQALETVGSGAKAAGSQDSISVAHKPKTNPLEKEINSSNKSTEPTKQILEETDQRSTKSPVSMNPNSVQKAVKSTEKLSNQSKKAGNKTSGDHNQEQDSLKPSKLELGASNLEQSLKAPGSSTETAGCRDSSFVEKASSSSKKSENLGDSQDTENVVVESSEPQEAVSVITAIFANKPDTARESEESTSAVNQDQRKAKKTRKAAQQNKKKKEEKKAKEEAKRNQIFETSSKLEQKIEEYLELEKMKRNGFTIMNRRRVTVFTYRIMNFAFNHPEKMNPKDVATFLESRQVKLKKDGKEIESLVYWHLYQFRDNPIVEQDISFLFNNRNVLEKFEPNYIKMVCGEAIEMTDEDKKMESQLEEEDRAFQGSFSVVNYILKQPEENRKELMKIHVNFKSELDKRLDYLEGRKEDSTTNEFQNFSTLAQTLLNGDEKLMKEFETAENHRSYFAKRAAAYIEGNHHELALPFLYLHDKESRCLDLEDFLLSKTTPPDAELKRDKEYLCLILGETSS